MSVTEGTREGTRDVCGLWAAVSARACGVWGLVMMLAAARGGGLVLVPMKRAAGWK